MGLGEEGRRAPMARVLIAFPMISGVFFGLLSAALVSRLGGFGRATEVGLLVGGVMFTANAAALCIVQASAWEEDRGTEESPAHSPGAEPISEERAS
jgi:hypothetical protein